MAFADQFIFFNEPARSPLRGFVQKVGFVRKVAFTEAQAFIEGAPLLAPRAAWEAASRASGTLNGEQDT